MFSPLKRNLRALPAVLFAVTLGGGCLAAQDGGLAVRGTVVNSLSGQPVPGALVWLSPDYAMLTDGSGQFSFDHVPAGQHMVSVRKPGYQGFGETGGLARLGGRGEAQREAPPRLLIVGPDLPSLTFRIEPQASITGQITLSTADDAGGIALLLYRRHMMNGHPHWEQAADTKTRSDGSFYFGDLAPGNYLLASAASPDAPDAGAESQLPTWGYPPEYYPGVTDPGSAGVMHLGPGQEAEADFTLTRQAFYRVTFAVRSAETSLPANFEILDAGGRPSGLEAQYDLHQQLVHAHVPNGSWILDAHAYGTRMEWGRTPFQVAGAPVQADISVVQIPQLLVYVRRDFTAPTQEDPNNPGLGLTWSPGDQDAFDSGGAGLMPVPNANGRAWQILLAEPGQFWVNTVPFPPGYVSSITSGGVDLASNPLIVAPGSAPQPIQITLHDDSASLTGQVTETGAGAAGEVPQGWVYAIPLFATTMPLPEASLHSDGTFSLANLAPGTYRVVACDTPQEIDFHSSDGLAAWTGKGQTVTLEPGGTAQVSLLHMLAVGDGR